MVRVRVPVSNELKAAVTRAAHDMGISQAEFCRWAIREQLPQLEAAVSARARGQKGGPR